MRAIDAKIDSWLLCPVPNNHDLSGPQRALLTIAEHEDYAGRFCSWRRFFRRQTWPNAWRSLAPASFGTGDTKATDIRAFRFTAELSGIDREGCKTVVDRACVSNSSSRSATGSCASKCRVRVTYDLV